MVFDLFFLLRDSENDLFPVVHLKETRKEGWRKGGRDKGREQATSFPGSLSSASLVVGRESLGTTLESKEKINFIKIHS